MGKRGRFGSEMYAYAAVAAILAGLIYFWTGGFGAALNLSSDVGADLLAVLPGLLIFIVGVVALAKYGAGKPFVIAAFAAMSIGMAVLLQEMYDASIIVDAMIAGASIGQVETIIIIAGIMVGGVAYATNRR